MHIRDARPSLHLTPPANWLNDPNGLRYVDGVLHVTYQHNPDAPRWGRIHWGYATSPDLVTWTHQPIALSPGDGVDEFGCWSGSMVDDDGVANLFYTGVRLDGKLRRQTICRATSVNGSLGSWRKDPANPLVAGPPGGIEADLFRDPFVFRDRGQWAMLVGGGSARGHGTVLLYRSPNLRDWSYAGPIISAEDLDPTLDADGPMWECPQLVRLDGLDVLIVSVVDRAPGIRPSHVTALVGHLEDDRFTPTRVSQLGMGPDFYAPAATVLPDGRCLLFGWIPEDPPPPGSARTWAGSLTLPRILSVRHDGAVALGLADEVIAARGQRRRSGPHELAADVAWRKSLPDGTIELGITVEPLDADEVSVELRESDQAEPIARIAFEPDGRQLTVARSGIVSVAGRSSMSATTLPDADGRILRLRLILDGSILEMEANGHTMATARLAESASVEPKRVEIRSRGGRSRLHGLELWPLSAG